jgi:hypothetical protein
MNPASPTGMYLIYLDRSKPSPPPFLGTAFRRCRINQPIAMLALEEKISPLLIDHSGTV